VRDGTCFENADADQLALQVQFAVQGLLEFQWPQSLMLRKAPDRPTLLLALSHLPQPIARDNRESAQEFFGEQPLFAFQLELAKQERTVSATYQNASSRSSDYDPFLTLEPMGWQRTVDFEFAGDQSVGSRELSVGTRPGIHRPDMAIEFPTGLRPINPTRAPIQLWRIGCRRIVLGNNSTGLAREEQVRGLLQRFRRQGCQPVMQ